MSKPILIKTQKPVAPSDNLYNDLKAVIQHATHPIASRLDGGIELSNSDIEKVRSELIEKLVIYIKMRDSKIISHIIGVK